MAKGKLLVIILGLTAALLLIAACGGSSGASPAATATSEPTAALGAGTSPLLQPIAGGETAEVRQASSTIQFSTNQQVGIWVTGRGEVTTVPDLSILETGVEARAQTVSEANSQAAQAMDRIVQVLKARGIQDTDIQTRFFNISPEYVWNDTKRRQELVGYRVSNQATVKIRDVDSVGPIIDEVATTGGDLVRIQGVRFTVENREALETQAREKAVKALIAKAEQFAKLTGVQLGRLGFLSESGGFTPRPVTIQRAFAEAAPAAAAVTPISVGELKVVVSLQGVFAIE